MWKPIEIGEEMFFMKYCRDDNIHRVYFSDVLHVWMESLTSDILSQRCKELNSLIEAEPNILAKHVYTLVVNDETNTCITSKVEGKSRLVNIESQLVGIPFYFTFQMDKLDDEMVYLEMTQPLIILALQQQKQLAQLCDVLKAKDAEIEQFKLEGAILKKKKLQTQPFSKENIMVAESGSPCKITKPAELFAKLCPYLSNKFQNCPDISERVTPENEVEHHTGVEIHQAPEPQLNTGEVINMHSASTSMTSDEKLIVKPKISKSKKPKLRI